MWEYGKCLRGMVEEWEYIEGVGSEGIGEVRLWWVDGMEFRVRMVEE